VTKGSAWLFPSCHLSTNKFAFSSVRIFLDLAAKVAARRPQAELLSTYVGNQSNDKENAHHSMATDYFVPWLSKCCIW